jgi:pyruvate dehydrogenase E2 component (dihydrolipoamide acetyltransferase)
MPKQGLLMEEGIITKWLVKEGETTTEGSPLFEMETDKLNITIESTATGTLLKILHPEGDVVPITQPIAIVGQTGEDISNLLSDEVAVENHTISYDSSSVISETAKHAPSDRVFSSPRARLRAEENGINVVDVPGSGFDGLVIERDVIAYMSNKPSATPLAANIAKEQDINLKDIVGTGVNNKITTADLIGTAIAKTHEGLDTTGQMSRGTRIEVMNSMRNAISRNMLASKFANAQTNHRMFIDMTAVIALRKQYKILGIDVSYNDIIICACAKALVDSPIINASVDGNNIIYHDYVNVGIAVSVPGGLIVPVVKDADIIGLRGIANKSSELIEKAHSGNLNSQDYHGGTFTVSSLGMFDMDDFVAIINPPESAIMAVGKIAKTPVVVSNAKGDDEVAIKQMCALCLSYDHRIINGSEAAEFLQKVKKYLHNPVLMI